MEFFHLSVDEYRNLWYSFSRHVSCFSFGKKGDKMKEKNTKKDRLKKTGSKKTEPKKTVSKKTVSKKETVKSKKVKKQEKKNIFEKITTLFHEVKVEMKKVKWPARKEMITYSSATILFILLFGAFFTLADVIIAGIKMLVA